MTLAITDWESTARKEFSECSHKHMGLLTEMVEQALQSPKSDEEFRQIMQLFAKLAGGDKALAERAGLDLERLQGIQNVGRMLPPKAFWDPLLQLCWAVIKNQSPLQPLLSCLGLEAEVTTRTASERQAPAREDSRDDNQYDLPFDPWQRVEDLELSARSLNCLKNDSIYLLGDLVQKKEDEMRRWPGFGKLSLLEVKEVLSAFGARLGMSEDHSPGLRQFNEDLKARKIGPTE